ncbi:MAG: MarR family transcriptional regulator, partial [Rhodobacteraceae bacterium]|nr:MarR family transcriptional regulator [Paracoccaceae bacterium]
DRLEEAGFTTRMRDRRDRRIVNIELTPRGAELEQQAANIQLAVVCETQMQEGALNSLRSELQALTEKLETEGETTD